MEFVVRRQLDKQQESLAGLFDGNPQRRTTRPTAERLLAAFVGITLYCHRDGSYEMSPLSSLQKQILSWMGIPASLYTFPQLVPG